MKDFFKFTLATITGIILTSIVMFVISIIVVFSMLSSTETETVVEKNSIMMLDLNGSLVERTSDNIFKELFRITSYNVCYTKLLRGVRLYT